MALIVVDASMIASFLLPDEFDTIAFATIAHMDKEGGAAPNIFWHEIRNILTICIQRDRLAPRKAERLMLHCRHLRIHDHGAGDDAAILDLAAKHNLSAYDSAYLELSLRLNAPFASLDKRLNKAASAEGVVLFEP